MAAITLTPNSAPQALEEEKAETRRHLWTRDELYRAMAAGVFSGEPLDTLKMELIGGELFEKMPQNRPHSMAIELGRAALMHAFPVGHYIASQVPMRVDRHNEPEPDLMVVVGSPRDYADHPTATALRLVMEIADTSLGIDRNQKARLYARAGVADYWVLMLNSRTLEIRRDPAERSDAPGQWEYRSTQTFAEGDMVSPLYAPEFAVTVADLLPLPPKPDEATS